MTASRWTDRGRRRLWSLRERLPPPVRHGLGKLYRRFLRRDPGGEVGPPGSRTEQAYLAALLQAPVRPGLVFYESFGGASMNCSPRAIFERLLDDPLCAHLEHVWSVADPAAVPEALRRRPTLRLVKPGSTEAVEAMATAQTVISNSTLPPFFMTRPGQRYVNTWHGVPLKRMFKHESDQLTVHRNSQRNLLQATHLLLPNRFTAEILLGSADLREAAGHKVICTGAPRVDETLNADRRSLRAELAVPEGCRIVLIAPTWRGYLGKAETEAPMLAALLRRLETLDPEKHAIFVQLHAYTGRAMRGQRSIPAGMSTNRFLGAVDVLVTDYSSIMFDVLALGRQVILFAYDRHQYEELRGLNVPLEDLPVTVCPTVADVVAELREADGAAAAQDPRFASARERFWPLEDGRAAERAVEAILAAPPAPAPAPARRPRILFYGGGWRSNGITTSMVNLLAALAPCDADLYVVTDGLAIDHDPELARNLRRVPPEVRLLHRAGGMLRTKAENERLERFYATNRFEDEAHEALLRGLFEREARRMFGDLDFDVAIDFSGYARFWSMLLASVPARRHVIFQHNDLLSEARKRFDLLHGVFSTYRWHDAVVSVSGETRAVNLRNLGHHYRSAESALTVRNMIDPAAIRRHAAEEPPKALARRPGRARFVTVGRLSPEKAQGRAIRALARLVREGHDVELLVIGGGPLRDELAAQAAREGVPDRVVFAGQLDNPFPAVAHADCFVLPSDYEGQPMVLLEALCLGQPVIATDIPGSRAVLGDGLGLLVPADDEGVADGMRRFLEGRVTAGAFDAEAYRAEVMQEFLDRVLQMPLALATPPSPTDTGDEAA